MFANTSGCVCAYFNLSSVPYNSRLSFNAFILFIVICKTSETSFLLYASKSTTTAVWYGTRNVIRRLRVLPFSVVTGLQRCYHSPSNVCVQRFQINYNSRAIVYIESFSFVFFCFEDFGSFVSKAERGETLNVAGPEKGGALPTGNPIPPCFS